MHTLFNQVSGFAAALLASVSVVGAAHAAAPTLGTDGRPVTLRDIHPTPRPAIEPKKAALLIIDAQNEYADGLLPLENFDVAVAQINALRKWADETGVLVIHIRQLGAPTSRIFTTGGHGFEIVPELTPATGEVVMDKPYPNSFHRTDLQKILKDAGRDQLIITGFMTHMCVDATSRAGFDLGYRNYVVADATADRPLPEPAGGVMPAAMVKRGALAALNDRFAWVLKDAGEVKAAAK